MPVQQPTDFCGYEKLWDHITIEYILSNKSIVKKPGEGAKVDIVLNRTPSTLKQVDRLVIGAV